MLTLAITLLVALYLIAPELLSRSIIGSRRPVKVVPRTRSEELFHGIVWALFPLTLALLFALACHGWRWPQVAPVVCKIFEDLYSEPVFRNDRAFYPAVDAFLRFNLWLLLPLYTIVISLSLTLVAFESGSIPSWLSFLNPVFSRLARAMLPSIPELYLLLAADRIRSRSNLEKHVDVLTKSGTLYRGRVGTLAFNTDGTLQLLLLENPRRFLSDEYKAKKKDWPNIPTETFWTDIPGNNFVIVGSEVDNLNLRFVPRNPVAHATSEQKSLTERLLETTRVSTRKPAP